MSTANANDRSTFLAFLGFWILLVLVCAAGIALFHGSRGNPSAASVAPPAAHAASATATPLGADTLSVASIFSTRPPRLSAYHKQQLIRLIATGDVIPARSVNYKMVEYNDFQYPFERTAAYLRTGDITLINLEAPLVAGCPTTDSGMTFCGDPRAVQGLTLAGVDMACTANNHIGNFGDAGIQETWAHLFAAHIPHCGLGVMGHLTVKGIRFAFLAYNCVGQRFDYGVARSEIREARKHADVVIVSVHWGKEYVAVPATEPGVADDDPRRVARWIIDSGADLIIGNHPHHVQGVEMYRGHLITYAHGNFAFDQFFSTETREGVVGTYTFAGRHLVAVRFHPVFIYDYAQPRWATAAQSAQILRDMRASSLILARHALGRS